VARNPFKPPLNVVAPPPTPPPELGKAGRELWTTLTENYALDDVAGLEMLKLGCLALDRAEALRTRINETGEMVEINGMMRDNPLLRHEAVSRAAS
jgi:hypothetical protein